MKRKTGRPHKGWKAAAKKILRRDALKPSIFEIETRCVCGDPYCPYPDFTTLAVTSHHSNTEAQS